MAARERVVAGAFPPQSSRPTPLDVVLDRQLRRLKHDGLGHVGLSPAVDDD